MINYKIIRSQLDCSSLHPTTGQADGYVWPMGCHRAVSWLLSASSCTTIPNLYQKDEADSSMLMTWPWQMSNAPHSTVIVLCTKPFAPKPWENPNLQVAAWSNLGSQRTQWTERGIGPDECLITSHDCPWAVWKTLEKPWKTSWNAGRIQDETGVSEAGEAESDLLVI